MKKRLILLLLLLSIKSSWAQTIFSENIGSPTSTTTLTAITFQNSGSLTYSNGSQTNSADVRATSNSAGSYTGASGGGNIFFSATSGAYGYAIEGINASSYTSVSLQFGYKKESASAHAAFSVEYWNGTAWATLANTAATVFNEAATASAVWYASKTIALPTAAQINGLKIRFVKTGTTAIRIDDVKLTGTEIAPSVTNTVVSNITTNSVLLAGNVTATGGSTIIATGSVYAVTATNAAPVIGGSGVVVVNTSSPNSGTGAFSNSSGTVLSPNVQYSYTAYATKSTGLSGYGMVASFYTLAVTPSAPTVGSATANSLKIAIGSDTNSVLTTYAVLETTTASYVQADGTLGNLPVFQSAAVWATKTVTGLAAGTIYSFQVVAKNGAGIETLAGPTTSATTSLVAPSISTTGTIAALNTTYGTASSVSSFTVTGANITQTIVITAPLGFEVSNTSGGTSGYAATLTLTPSNGTVSATTIYVRLAATAPFGTYSGNISLVTNGLTVNVACVPSTVAKLELTINGVTAVNKVCDGTTTATLSGTPTLNGVLANDLAAVSLVVTSPTANFADALVGIAKPVIVTGYALTGSAASNYYLTLPTGLSADITANASSDVILNTSSSAGDNENIAYKDFQAATITSVNGANGSVGVMGFYLRDGGAGLNDADNLGTELAAISFIVTPAASIRSARLFVGTSPRGQSVGVSADGSTVEFVGLQDIIAADNNQKAINLRVTFTTNVSDNQQLQFRIVSVTANQQGSKFALPTGGGAASSLAGDTNRIEVTADRLAFVQQPPSSLFVGAFMNPAPAVVAQDASGNKDLDFSGTVTITSSGNLSNSPQTATASNGQATFDSIAHSAAGTGLVLTASSWGLTSSSSGTNFTVTPLIIPTFAPIDPICVGSVLSSLPTTATKGISGSWSPALDNLATTTYTFTPDLEQNASSTTLTIIVNPTITPTFAAIGPITAGASLAALPITSTNGIIGAWSPALNNTATTTYTFTPAAGQCATTMTLTITVNAAVVETPNEPSLAENYIKTTKFRKENGQSPVSSITYFDGLGRPIQQIAGKQSNSGKDIVTHIDYDDFGRHVKEYLPYASSQDNLSYIDWLSLPNSIQSQYYNLYGDSNPYSRKELETSPLNRVLRQAAPGNNWHLGSGHEIKLDYQTNVANEVKRFQVSLTADYDISLIDDGSYYEFHQLYKTITRDENDAITQEYKDKEGRIVMKRTYGSSSNSSGLTIDSWHETYYVYDIFGNLTYVIPPLVTNASQQLNDLCYQYKYDYRNRLIEKKLPGKQWEFIVYDKLDRVVATGPSYSPFGDGTWGWLITKYDVFNRPVYTGWENGDATTITRVSKQANQNTATAFSESKSTSNTSIETGITVNYTNAIAPITFKVLTVNYYDEYNFPDAAYEVIPGGFLTNTKSLATGSWTRVLTDTGIAGETSTTFYDYKARPICTYTKNYFRGFTSVDTKLDFSGKTIQTITKHKRSNNDVLLTINEEFTYTAQDRLETHTHQVNGGTIQLLAYNAYEELGQLMAKSVGNTLNTTLQKVDYSYNIRGWLTGINNDPTNNLILNTNEKDLFAFKINYNTTEGNVAGVKPLYNGNISETYYKSGSDNVLRKYGYQYDNLNRLQNAIYQKPGGNTYPTYEDYSEKNITYDKNGNIQTLYRNGDLVDALPANQIDNLQYFYKPNSNILTRVEDNSGNTSGFKDSNTLENDYGYDSNGNIIVDNNKGITAITYNHLNLPTKITFGTKGNINYIYNAAGQKVEKVFSFTKNETTTTTVTNYLGGFQYTTITKTNPILHYAQIQELIFPTAEGYVKNTSFPANTYNYVFNYTDHLGNIRLSYQDINSNGTIDTGEILEESNYYPFGMKHEGYNGNNLQPNYNYKYNGKELQDELGLNFYDYGARNYDPALGRWMNVDPLAEGSPNESPYVYCSNNPIVYNDPTGMIKELPDDQKLGKGDWHKSDRVNHTAVWDAANKYNIENNNKGQYEPYEQVAAFYKWVDDKAKDLGQEVKWMEGAYGLVKTLDTNRKAGGEAFIGDDVIKVLEKLNVAIADATLPYFKDLLYSGKSYTGEKAYQWDVNFVTYEQGTIAVPIYKGMSSTTLNKFNAMANGKDSKVGWYKFLSNFNYIDFGKYKANVWDTQKRIDIPLNMLYGKKHKVK